MPEAEVAEAAGYRSLLKRDWNIPQGADTVNGLRFGIETGGVITRPDLTQGWSARAQLRDVPGGTVWCTLTSDAATGPRIALEAGGFFTLIIDAATTETDAWDEYAQIGQGAYDVELVSPDGQVIRHTEGTVFLYPDVTRTEDAS